MSSSFESELSFTATVPRHLVHRAAICEVFLTDSRRRSENEFSIAVQLPRVHTLYSDHTAVRPSYDPMLLMEACRQVSILVAHRYLDVPLSQKFVFNTGELLVEDPDALLVGALPGHAVIDTAVTGRKNRAGSLVGVTLDMRITVDGRHAGSMAMTIQWMPAEAWNALRQGGRRALRLTPSRAYDPQRRMPPAAVGRFCMANVVLGAAEVQGDELVSQVVVDQRHPALFDHPLDHLPGMLLFEAFRQTAICAAHDLLGLSPQRVSLTRCAATFSRFGEFELPTACHARVRYGSTPRGVVRVELTLRQEEHEIASAEVDLVTTCALVERAEPLAALQVSA
jgi:hypothetical protein